MSPYLDDFEKGVKDDLLVIGNVSLEDVQEEERQLRDEHIQYLEQEVGVRCHSLVLFLKEETL